MSDKENFAKSIIDAWQNGIQNLVKDKQFIDLIVDNYAKFQDVIKTTSNEHFTSSDNRDAPSTVNELRELRSLLAALDKRISKLEKSSARTATDGSKAKPAKPAESKKRN